MCDYADSSENFGIKKYVTIAPRFDHFFPIFPPLYFGKAFHILTFLYLHIILYREVKQMTLIFSSQFLLFSFIPKPSPC